MQAMILAAGEGTRMRPLTNTIPKPLLSVGPHRLIDYHLQKLVALGFEQVVINVAYLQEKITAALGTHYCGMRIHYSVEPEPLETAGAILHALELLGEQPFLLINGDIWTDYDFGLLQHKTLADANRGHLVLVPNPSHNAEGDFAISRDLHVCPKQVQQPAYTFSGISLIDPKLICDYPQKRKKFPLREVFSWGINDDVITGEYYAGQWYDIGTPAALEFLDAKLREENSGH